MKRAQRKPRGGQLVWRKTKGWCARIPVTIDGERVRRLYELDTREKTVARRKMARLVAETADKSYTTTAEIEVAASRGDTFEEAYERVHQLRLKAGVKNARAEVSMLRRFAMPVLEGMEIAAVETKHVNMVLDHVASLGLGRESLGHMKQALRAVFKQLKREGEIRENPVIDSELPRLPAVARRERVLMSDDELGQYLEYRPESDRDVAGVLERQTMAAVSRMFGGLRTGDLHALDWATHIDTEAFIFGVAPREKTATPQLLVIPELLRPTLRAWWERHGCPESGPVFPQRHGKLAGEQRNRQSHAKALRRDLRRMMGVERRVTKTRIETRHNALAQVRRTTWQQKPKAEWTRRERELFAETDYSLPVDFHSFRRAFNTGLAEAGVNIQEAMRLAGHTSASAHMRYVMSRVREVPVAALPRIGIHGHGSRALSSADAAQPSAASDDDESGDVSSAYYGTDNEPCAPFTPATRVQIPQGTQALSPSGDTSTGMGHARRDADGCAALQFCEPIWLDDVPGLARALSAAAEAGDAVAVRRWAQLIAEVA